MNNKLQQTLDSHGKKVDFIAQRVVENSEILSRRGEQIDFIAKKVVENSETLSLRGEQIDFIALKVAENSNRLDKHDDRLDKITLKLLEHDEQFLDIRKNMATKKDIRGITRTLDKIVGLVQKRDQEMTMLAHAQIRQQDQIDGMSKDINVMKPMLGIG